ncbi:hypothetical protein CH373_13130 [Leptospira perolatii]|uniref:Uncharacterized protein n=1 Tax=Leptospira perolatii TaxID=2023191 RepID=A0A2M9ZL25_9LEPT|nr:hypothetical protein CH360_08555 [Leptospira perolatii]PJZ72735.1 hypothetical protein CH373_13130 [Leptospira perolatii]
MFITAENIKTGEVRTFEGTEKILVPDMRQKEEALSVPTHWETVENCLDLRKYSRFFLVSESSGRWMRCPIVNIKMKGFASERGELSLENVEIYRVLGIFL